MERLNRLNRLINNKVAVKENIQSQLESLESKEKKLKVQVIKKERALELVKSVGLATQSQLEYHLSDMVSTGLNTVFDDVYDFKVQFEIHRGKTECNLFFEKDGELAHPKFSGGGELDIAAFCLRCAAWSMKKKYRPVLVLDEPWKHLKGEKENTRAIQLMKTLSRELGLQIICVNDERISRDIIIEHSDKVFLVDKNKGISKIDVLK